MARILVVDDRPLNRELLRTILGYAHHEVVEAGDGVEALELVRTQPLDLIISDILMPTMDGVTFVKEIRANPRFDHIQVIFYTATYRLIDAQKMADSCGVRWVLPKPCEPEVIFTTVNKSLGISAPLLVPPPIEAPPSSPTERNVLAYLKDLHQLNAHITAIVARGSEIVGQGGLIERATQALTGTLGNLETVSLRLSAILEASLGLDLERNPVALISLFCQQIRDVVSSRFAVLAIGEDPQAPLVHLTVHGLPKEQWEPFQFHSEFLRRLMQEGKTQRVTVPPWEPSHWGLPVSHPPCHCLLVIPVASPRRTYGWVYLADRIGVASFSEEDEKLASILASHFAVAYENLQLVEDLQTQIRDRIRAEETGLRLNEIVEASPDAIISVGLDRRITNWSRGAERLFGYSEAEAVGEPWAMLVPPELVDQETSSINSLQRGTRLPAYETLRLRKNGTPAQVTIQMTTIQDAAHSVIGFSAIMRDITERQSLEVALLTSAAQFQNVFNNVDVLIWSYDPVGNHMLEVSPACEDLFGLPPQAFFANPQLMFETVHPEDQHLLARQMEDLRKGLRTRIEYRLLRPDGTLRWVLSKTKPAMEAGGTVVRLDGTITDITDRKRVEEELEARTTQLDNVFQNVDEVLWSFDARNGRIITISPACERVYGRPASAFYEHPLLFWAETLRPEDQEAAMAAFDQLLLGHPVEREECIVKPDGTLRWVIIKAKPQTDSSGQVIRIDGSVSDITESRRTKERMAQQERLVALGTLVGTVAHDIRNPLMAMTAAAELLAAGIPATDRSRRHLDILDRASARISALVNELLDFATPKPLELEPIPDQVLLQEVIEACGTAAAQRNVRVELQVDGNSPELFLDPHRMHQVLRNILENAIQHAPPNSCVRISSSFKAGFWSCTVEDEGSGIANEDLPRIFDPLFTKRPGGTGLGLAIAYRIVHQHGGELGAENRPAGGTAFEIRLPMMERMVSP